MELPFAGVHHPYAVMLERLPAMGKDALWVPLGLSSTDAPERFLVALARRVRCLWLRRNCAWECLWMTPVGSPAHRVAPRAARS